MAWPLPLFSIAWEISEGNYYAFFLEKKDFSPSPYGQKTEIYPKPPSNHLGNGMQNKLRMPSKETILAKIKANRPNLWPLPDVPIFETLATDKKKLFIQILERGGSKVRPRAPAQINKKGPPPPAHNAAPPRKAKKSKGKAGRAAPAPRAAPH